MDGLTAAIVDMDDDSALDWILSQGQERFIKVPKEKVVHNKMMDCLTCKDKSKSQCFKCMDSFYSHMHDENTKRLKVEGEQVRLVRHPVTGKRYDPKHTKAAIL